MTDRTREAVIEAARKLAMTALTPQLRYFGKTYEPVFRGAVDETLAALADAGMLHAPAEWRPISEAPKDGTEVDLWLRAPYSRRAAAHWYEPWECWIEGADPAPDDERFGIGSRVPSHFRLPPPPPGDRDHG